MINDSKHDLRALWLQVNSLLKPPLTPSTQDLAVDDFATCFRSKIDGIRAATASALVLDIEACTVSVSASFLPATKDEISDNISKSPKHCELDPLPT